MSEEIRRKSSAAFPSVIHAKEVTEVTWFSTMMVWGIFLLILSLGFYGWVQYVYISSLSTDTNSLTKELRRLSKEEIPQEQREQVLGTYSQVLNIKNLLRGHIYSTKLIYWLEKNTQKNIFIENITISVQKDTIELVGKGPDKDSVSEQIFAFESADEVKSVKLTDAQFQNTPASFHMTLTLKPGFALSLE